MNESTDFTTEPVDRTNGDFFFGLFMGFLLWLACCFSLGLSAALVVYFAKSFLRIMG